MIAIELPPSLHPAASARRLSATAGLFGLAAAILSAALLQPLPAMAQDSTAKALSDRLNRLERQISDLERWSYREGKGPPPNSAAVSGATAPPTSGQLADAELRLSRLENQLRQLNGQIERIAHEVRSAGQRLDKLVGDVDFRLTEIERQISQRPANPNMAAADRGQQPANSNLPANLGAGVAAPNAASGTTTDQDTSQQTAGLPAGTPMEQYDYAYALLSKQKLAEAQQAFEQFLQQHNEDKLAGNAQYWLGEIYYTNGELQQAAKAFLEGVQRWPDGNKAPDSLLKLAISLRRLNQIEDACATLLELDKRFPDMEARIRRRLDRERQTAACS